jgi:hypothetical protein
MVACLNMWLEHSDMQMSEHSKEERDGNTQSRYRRNKCVRVSVFSHYECMYVGQVDVIQGKPIEGIVSSINDNFLVSWRIPKYGESLEPWNTE